MAGADLSVVRAHTRGSGNRFRKHDTYGSGDVNRFRGHDTYGSEDVTDGSGDMIATKLQGFRQHAGFREHDTYQAPDHGDMDGISLRQPALRRRGSRA